MQTFHTLVDVLRQRAAAVPDQCLYTLLADGEIESGSLTYAELDVMARHVAQRLLQDASPGDRAMLLYPVGLDYLVGFFGCLYAGIIAVPAYPLKAENKSGGRIRTMIADCTPRLVLTCARLVPSVKSALAEVEEASTLQVLGTDDYTGGDSSEDVSVRIDGHHVAFLQYTSASIAEPKGVRVTHANLIANQEMIRHAMAHDEHSTFVSWLPPYHDMGLVGNLLHPLYLGSSCVFMPSTAFVQKPVRWLSAISKYRARTSGAPTFAYDLCVKKVMPEQCEGLDLSSWTIAYCGAEMVDAQVLERFSARYLPFGFRAESLYPCYGLAEVTLLASGNGPQPGVHAVEADSDWLEQGRLQECPASPARRIVSCGTVPAGTAIAIVDPERGTEKSQGEVGEIWIHGAHVADGYWNRAEVSREVFGATLAGRPETYLRTGDLGSTINGQLYVVGRIKEVIIHQGRNIHPTDVERIVERSVGERIDSCVAFSIPGDASEEVGIVIEVGKRAESVPLVETVNAIGETVAWDLFRQLDVWPARIGFVRRGGIPRTSSGKKQRLRCSRLLLAGELPLVAEWQGSEAASGVKDEDGTYGWLAKLLSRFTGIPLHIITNGQDGVRGWGLDSMRAVQIAHHIERRTGVCLPVSLFYERASFDAIVQEIERHAKSPDKPDGEDRLLGTTADSTQMDITRGQEAIWFSQQINPESPAFHLCWALHTTSALDPDRLRDAVREVVARHEVLRCVFDLSTETRVTGRTLPAGSVDYKFLAGPDETLHDWIDREGNRQFNLAEDLLVRVRHGRGNNGDLLAFCLHHLITDLWSCALFTEEVLDEYVTGSAGEYAPTYRHYVRHVRRVEAAGEAHRQYWRDRLSSAGTLDPVDVLARSIARPPVRLYKGACVSTTLGEAESRMLLESARALRVSKQMLMLAVYGAWMWSATELEDFLSGCVSSGRSRANFWRMQGLFSNPFALRFRLDAKTTFSDLLESTREQVLGAIEREDYPFQAVVEDIRPHRDLARTPLFQNMFVYQQLPESSRLGPCVLGGKRPPFMHRGLEISCVPLPTLSARYDLTLYCIEIDARLTCEVVYNTALFSHSQISEMLGRYESLLYRLPRKRFEAIAQELTPVG